VYIDFEYAGKRLSDFGYITCKFGGSSDLTDVEIGCDITFSTVKNNHSSIHYNTSSSYENVYTTSLEIMKNPCNKNQDEFYHINEEISMLTSWLNRREYHKFKPLTDNGDFNSVHYYGSFNVKEKIINDKVVGFVLLFTGNAPYGFGEQIKNEVDMDCNVNTITDKLIYINDCAKNAKPNIKLFGKTTQRTTEGKNLWNKEYASDINNWILKEDNQYYKRVAIYVGKGNTVTLSYPTPPSGLEHLYVCITLEDSYLSNYKTWIYNKNNDDLLVTCVTLNASVDGYIYIWCLDDGLKNGNFMQYIGENLQIEYGFEATEYEEYTGRIPSPNMNYPQKVVSLGESGSIVGKMLNANVFNPTFRNKNNKIWSSNCDVTENDGIFSVLCKKEDMCIWNVASDGVVHTYENSTFGELMAIPDDVSEISVTLSNTGFNKNFITFFNEDKVAIKTRQNLSNVFTQKIEEGAKYFILRFGKGDAVVGEIYETTVMVNYGEPMNYESYTEQPFTALTPNGLKGIDDVGDYIDYTVGKTIQRIQKIACDENSNISDVSLYSSNKVNSLYRIKTDNSKQRGKIMCTHMPCNASVWGDNFGCYIVEENGIDFAIPYDVLGITKDATGDEKVSALKTWISQNGALEFYVELAEPIITDLTDEEMAEYSALIMNYPNTTIVNDAGAYMEVTYLQDYDNEFVICGDSDEYKTMYPNISITCKRDGDLRIKNSVTGNIFEVLNCSEGETIYVNGEHKFIDSDDTIHKSTTLFNDFNYNYLDINVSEDDFSENIYEISMPCKIVIDYSPIRKVGV
jgi:hypothetical protein